MNYYIIIFLCPLVRAQCAPYRDQKAASQSKSEDDKRGSLPEDTTCSDFESTEEEMFKMKCFRKRQSAKKSRKDANEPYEKRPQGKTLLDVITVPVQLSDQGCATAE